MTTRSAVDTIRGYFYQFDLSILSILQLEDASSTIAVECIEDVDIQTATDTTAVQCKYYAGTEYNHSAIKNAVLHMLTHFNQVRLENRTRVSYLIRGHYSSGQEKLPWPIDLAFLKRHFLTYTKKGVTHCQHDKLSLDDTDLMCFLSALTIDVNAASFDVQFSQVIDALRFVYKCSPFASEYFYYNNALAIIRKLATRPMEADRIISKRAFLEEVDTSSILFNQWFVLKKGQSAHHRALRKEYFSHINISPFERFFLIEIDKSSYIRSELKSILYEISRKWSKLSRRDEIKFCPYVYIEGLTNNELLELKNELWAEQFMFNDGFDYYGANFSAKSIYQTPTLENGVRLKILNSAKNLKEALTFAVTRPREVWQFHLGTTYFEFENDAVKHVKIQTEHISNIKEII